MRKILSLPHLLHQRHQSIQVDQGLCLQECLLGIGIIELLKFPDSLEDEITVNSVEKGSREKFLGKTFQCTYGSSSGEVFRTSAATSLSSARSSGVTISSKEYNSLIFFASLFIGGTIEFSAVSPKSGMSGSSSAVSLCSEK